MPCECIALKSVINSALESGSTWVMYGEEVQKVYIPDQTRDSSEGTHQEQHDPKTAPLVGGTPRTNNG